MTAGWTMMLSERGCLPSRMGCAAAILVGADEVDVDVGVKRSPRSRTTAGLQTVDACGPGVRRPIWARPRIKSTHRPRWNTRNRTVHTRRR